MIQINYQKRKNAELFKSLENPHFLSLSKIQNYIPVYKRFFSLNETNYNSINFNQKWYISNVNEANEYNKNLYTCNIKNTSNQKTKKKEVFFKLAPLLNPYTFLIGKYDVKNEALFKLPSYDSTEQNTNSEFTDFNNSAYVDGFFLFLTSNLIHDNNFIHGVDYYGSFLAIKNNFKLDIFDDIDYLNNSDFFNKNKNSLFKVDNYEHLFNDKTKLKPIKIEHNNSSKSLLSIQSLNSDIFENIFDENTLLSENSVTDLQDLSGDLFDLHSNKNNDNKNNDNNDNDNEKNVTLNSSSTCSSRSSYTNENDSLEEVDNDSSEVDNDSKEGSDSSDESKEEKIYVTIPSFPVEVICMEYCENTFDDLILSNDLSHEEWYSALLQIIMILITYQKAFSFTHNDLHTNNVMYNYTDKKYIYYCYKKQYYKVPTFGRIFKIIDFGRSIYKFNDKLFCSNSFKTGGDAATQYNTEPYFNEKKPRLEPNFSFDICRLACSIFDYLVEDMDEIKNLEKCDPVKRLIVEWCLDDKGVNLLYKNNGSDRYPDFKLYKMIARCVHNHTPQAQLERPEFKAFTKFNGSIPTDFIDIDKIPICT